MQRPSPDRQLVNSTLQANASDPLHATPAQPQRQPSTSPLQPISRDHEFDESQFEDPERWDGLS